MAEKTASTQANITHTLDGERVPAEEYVARYAHDFYEWVRGELLKTAPVSEKHDALTRYFALLFEAYFSLSSIGQLRQQPFVMRLDEAETRREPDLQIILESNAGEFTETAMIGPADICIEVVSEESVARDHGEKFAEYEKAGVREYWIVDPIRQICRFNQRNAEGVYDPQQMGKEGVYETPLLPGLKLDVAILWQAKLPGYFETGQAVQEMLAEK